MSYLCDFCAPTARFTRFSCLKVHTCQVMIWKCLMMRRTESLRAPLYLSIYCRFWGFESNLGTLLCSESRIGFNSVVRLPKQSSQPKNRWWNSSREKCAACKSNLDKFLDVFDRIWLHAYDATRNRFQRSMKCLVRRVPIRSAESVVISENASIY